MPQALSLCVSKLEIRERLQISLVYPQKSLYLCAEMSGGMETLHLHSIQEISVTYSTGDMPVLVLWSDKQQYICKYMRPNATIAYKACELIAAVT